jgi:hypothetical protein
MKQREVRDVKYANKLHKRHKSFLSARSNARKLKHFLQEKGTSSHPLYVIRKKKFLEVEKNCVILTGMERTMSKSNSYSDGGSTTYTVEKIGENVSHLFRNQTVDDNMVYNVDV